jgi:plastocyanin
MGKSGSCSKNITDKSWLSYLLSALSLQQFSFPSFFSAFSFLILALPALSFFFAISSDAATLRGAVSVPKGVPTAADIVVFIEEIPNKTFAPPQKPLVMDQRDYKFIPRVLPVLVGSTVEFPNSDPDTHNAYSAADCCKFDLGHYPQGESRSVRFEKVGIAEILCNIHPQMGAYVLVLQNPFYCVTDTSGAFEIRDVPEGQYTLVVWHEVLPTIRQKITVGRDDLELKFELQTWTPVVAPQPPKEMALVAEGEFVMGADDRLPNEKPRRTVKLPAFWIDRAEVTNAQFCDFLNAFRNNREEEGVRWINLDDPECKIRAGEKRGEFVVEKGFENHPVVCVSWYGVCQMARQTAADGSRVGTRRARRRRTRVPLGQSTRRESREHQSAQRAIEADCGSRQFSRRQKPRKLFRYVGQRLGMDSR